MNTLLERMEMIKFVRDDVEFLITKFGPETFYKRMSIRIAELDKGFDFYSKNLREMYEAELESRRNFD